METAFTLSLAGHIAVPSPRGSFDGIIPLNWNMKHWISGFLSIFESQVPLLKNFWRRYCHTDMHGRQKGGGQNGHLPPPLENGTKKQKFLENVKSAFLILMSWVNSCNNSLFADMTQTLTLQKSHVHCSRRQTAGPAPASKSAKLRSTTKPFAQWKLILTHLQPSKILEEYENKEKLFELNMYFVGILIRFCAYSNNLQSL